MERDSQNDSLLSRRNIHTQASGITLGKCQIGSIPKKFSSVNHESIPSNTSPEASRSKGSVAPSASSSPRASLFLAFSSAVLKVSTLFKIKAPWSRGLCSAFMARSNMSCAASWTVSRHVSMFEMQLVNIWHVDRMNKQQNEIMITAESSTKRSLSFCMGPKRLD